MSLTQHQISHLAKLTALKGEKLNISPIIDSFETLGKVDTSYIKNVGRSGQGTLDKREDVSVFLSDISDLLLAQSGQKKAAHQIVLSGIMHSD